MRSTRIWTLIAGLVVAAGCAPDEPTASSDTASVTRASVTSASVTDGLPSTTVAPDSVAPPDPVGDPELVGEVDLVDVVSPGDDLPQRPFDDVVAHTIRDNEEWWAETFPELYGSEYTPIEGGFFPAYEGRGDPIPGCPGPEPMTIAEVESFLALYCSSGDFFAYDDRSVGPLADLIARHGTAVIAVILSHEWAHAVQSRAGVDLDGLPSILSEQQADCFAGAWAQRSMPNDSGWIRLDDADIDSIVRFYGDVADPADADPHGVNGHGSYLDRLGAFALGFDAGPSQCVDLVDRTLPLVADVAPLGPPQMDMSTTAEALNEYWGGNPIELVRSDEPAASTACDRWLQLPGDVRACPTTRLVEYDPDRESDASAAVLVANGWAVLNTTAEPSATAQLKRWCEVGVWLRDAADDDVGTSLTTGDIDAGLRTILDVTDDATLLMTASSYRRGVINGAC